MTTKLIRRPSDRLAMKGNKSLFTQNDITLFSDLKDSEVPIGYSRQDAAIPTYFFRNYEHEKFSLDVKADNKIVGFYPVIS